MRKTIVPKSEKNIYGYIKFEPNEGVTPIGVCMGLHGIGEGGPGTATTLPEVLKIGLPARLNSGQLELPLIFYFPQAPDSSTNNAWFSRQGLCGLNDDGSTSDWLKGKNMSDIIVSQHPQFKREQRIVYGISGGGKLAQATAILRPLDWGKLIGVCSAGYPTGKASNLKNTPSLFFHSPDDSTCPIAGTELMITAIKAAGGTAELIKTTGGHAGAWVQSSTNPKLIDFIIRIPAPAIPVPSTTPIPAPVSVDFTGTAAKHYLFKLPSGSTCEFVDAEAKVTIKIV